MIGPRYSLDVDHFFLKLFLTFPIIYYDSHYRENWLECVCSNNSQHFLSVHVTSVLRENFFSPVFWKKNRRHFSWRFFVSRFVFLNALAVNFWNLLLWNGVCQKAAWFPWLSGLQNFLFQLVFGFEVSIVTLNLRCYLFWLFSA